MTETDICEKNTLVVNFVSTSLSSRTNKPELKLRHIKIVDFMPLLTYC